MIARKAPTLIGKRPRRTLDTRPTSRQRGYDWTWEKLSKAWRNEHPLCVMCQAEGLDVAGECVDHIIPMHIAPERKYDPTNLQTLCVRHNTLKAKQDRTFRPQNGAVSSADNPCY